MSIMDKIATEQPDFQFDPGTIVCYQVLFSHFGPALSQIARSSTPTKRRERREREPKIQTKTLVSKCVFVQRLMYSYFAGEEEEDVTLGQMGHVG